ncbi:MAG: Rieske 2Fe-2S domain-containing protein [Pseudomonadota bacterium]
MAEIKALCEAKTLAPGERVRFELPGMGPALRISDDGIFRLVDDDCTHAIASLFERRLEGHVLFCLLRGGGFDFRTGGAAAGAAGRLSAPRRSARGHRGLPSPWCPTAAKARAPCCRTRWSSAG